MKNFFKFFGIIAIVAVIMVSLGGCNTLQSIEVTNEPTRTVYGQGQELSRSGMVVTGQFKKDSRDVSNEVTISGYNKDRAGQQTVTVTMKAGSKTASNTFTVTVVPVESISVSQPPSTTSFKQGDDHNWNGLSVGVKFENDAVPSDIVTPGGNALAITGYEKDKPGTQTITVDYYGKRATFDVKVVGLDGIAVTTQPSKTEYYTGEEIELAGLVVQGTWSDGSTARVNITNANLSGFDITRGERQNVTVTYSGKTATFPVTYIAFSALSVDRPPTKTKYELGEALDTTGIRIYGTWPGNSMAIVNNNRLKITGYDPLRAGEQRITVTVGGQSDTFTVTVTNPFEGTWSGEWQVGSQAVDGKSVAVMAPVSLTLDGSAWSLRTHDTKGEAVELRGVYTPESNTKARLQCDDRRGVGEINRDSSTVMRLKNGLITREITLRK
jgi:cytochrome c-type biogenesis protein CcmE